VRLAAIRATLEMAETMAVFNAERAVAGHPAIGLAIGVAIGVACGVACGEVVAGHAGVPPHARLHCIGEPVRLALALPAHALAN
jgi:class 3 adenylate cyclase